MHPHFFTDEEPGGHQRRDGADNNQQVGEREGIYQLLPRGNRHADGKQNRISHRGAEEFIHHLRALLQARRNHIRQLQQHREEQHANRRRQANQFMSEHAHHIQQHRQQRAGGQRRHISFTAKPFAFAQAAGFITAVRH